MSPTTGTADSAAARDFYYKRTGRYVPIITDGGMTTGGDICKALASGADAVMVGRAAQGKPWLPGQIARYLATGRRESAPPLAVQLGQLVVLYDEMLTHHGFIGLRHARKHLGWALDAAAEAAGVPAARLKAHRERVLTQNDPRAVHHRLAAAFDEFSEPEKAAA